MLVRWKLMMLFLRNLEIHVKTGNHKLRMLKVLYVGRKNQAESDIGIENRMKAKPDQK